ncbi:hypothetical protein [Roseovarius sp. Pro17]|uniref:hypothetical protein n=1 Tax=Roseovarius sp. Pro17 TaxID=3108175 RepID=UPI002D7733F5|nr:hypothetical protein [Roseovarius sp. Pro17]
MKRVYRITANTLAILGGFAAIGAGAMIITTAVMVGGLMALAAKLAIKGTATDAADSTDAGIDVDQVQA